jgi:hypothetical protein
MSGMPSPSMIVVIAITAKVGAAARHSQSAAPRAASWPLSAEAVGERPSPVRDCLTVPARRRGPGRPSDAATLRCVWEAFIVFSPRS